MVSKYFKYHAIYKLTPAWIWSSILNVGSVSTKLRCAWRSQNPSQAEGFSCVLWWGLIQPQISVEKSTDKQ